MPVSALRPNTPSSCSTAAAGIAALASQLKQRAAALDSRHREVFAAAGVGAPPPLRAASPQSPPSAGPSPAPAPAPAAAPAAAPAGLSPRRGGSTPGADSGPRSGAALRLLSDPPVPVVCDIPESATHRQKALGVYEELASARSGGVTMADLSAALCRCHIELATDTVDALFRRSDADGDGVLSESEFLRLSEVYPTLAGCLFHRSRAHWAQVSRQDELAAARMRLLQLEEEDRREQRAAEGASAEVAARQQQQLRAQQQLQNDEAQARQVRQRLDSAGEALAAARAATHDAQAAAAASRGTVRQAQVRLRDSERRREHAALQLQTQESRAVAAEERLQELEGLAREQRQEVAEMRRRSERAQEEVREAGVLCRAAEGDIAAAEAAQRELEAALTEAAERVAAAAATEQRAAADAQGVQRQVDASREAFEALGRQLGALRERVEELHSRRREGRTAAQEAVKEQEARVAALERSAAEDWRVRREQYDAEAPVLELEAQLRRRREELEMDEDRLRAHRRQLDSVRPPGLPPPSPSAKRYLPTPSPGGHRSPPPQRYSVGASPYGAHMALSRGAVSSGSDPLAEVLRASPA